MSSGYVYRLRSSVEAELLAAGELPDFLAAKQADADWHLQRSSTVGRRLAEGPPQRELSPNKREVGYTWPTALPDRVEQESWSAGTAHHPFMPYGGISPVCSAWVGTLYAGRTCGKLASEHEMTRS